MFQIQGDFESSGVIAHCERIYILATSNKVERRTYGPCDIMSVVVRANRHNFGSASEWKEQRRYSACRRIGKNCINSLGFALLTGGPYTINVFRVSLVELASVGASGVSGSRIR